MRRNIQQRLLSLKISYKKAVVWLSSRVATAAADNNNAQAVNYTIKYWSYMHTFCVIKLQTYQLLLIEANCTFFPSGLSCATLL